VRVHDRAAVLYT